jgi:hypothetical protein
MESINRVTKKVLEEIQSKDAEIETLRQSLSDLLSVVDLSAEDIYPIEGEDTNINGSFNKSSNTIFEYIKSQDEKLTEFSQTLLELEPHLLFQWKMNLQLNWKTEPSLDPATRQRIKLQTK